MSTTPIQASKFSGELTVFIEKCRDLKKSDMFGGKGDPYACLMWGKKKTLFSTPVIGNTEFPVWEATGSVHLSGNVTGDSYLTVAVYDKDGITSDCNSIYKVSVKELLNAPGGVFKVEGKNMLEKQKDGSWVEGKGTIWFTLTYKFDMHNKPRGGVDVHNLENYTIPPVSGIAEFYIEKCRDLPNLDGFGQGVTDPYVVVKLGKKYICTTPVIDDTLHPVWEHREKVFLTGTFLPDTQIEFMVFDEDVTTDELVGTYSTPLGAFIKTKKISGTFDLKNEKLEKKGTKCGTLTIDCKFSEWDEAPDGMKTYDLGNMYEKQWKKDGHKVYDYKWE